MKDAYLKAAASRKQQRLGRPILRFMLFLFSVCIVILSLFFLASPLTNFVSFSTFSQMTQVQDAFLQRNVLPASVTPTHYKLHLKPNLNTFRFEGHVEIK
jgi:hypothetical protein